MRSASSRLLCALLLINCAQSWLYSVITNSKETRYRNQDELYGAQTIRSQVRMENGKVMTCYIPVDNYSSYNQLSEKSTKVFFGEDDEESAL